MKIRNDYVSNSSSSSFMIVGHAYEHDELIKAALKLGFKPKTYDPDYEEIRKPSEPDPDDIDIDEDKEEEDENYDDIDGWEVLEWLEDTYGLRSHTGIYEFSDDAYCVGLDWDDMKGDETKNQFITRVGDVLEQVFGERPSVYQMVDGGMEC